ncbi:beta-1,3-galactosyltransferase 1 [Mytilus galloprovincialis]|uniref:Hexosyltransferase n=1 Tax=Mytilus galloprovincialis TaxID=29158 RepID=A0A8B6E8Z6_MYTGA|nr:beta-1,3-galactosyltransferase 1 [Mytilus galloprovincialis]
MRAIKYTQVLNRFQSTKVFNEFMKLRTSTLLVILLIICMLIFCNTKIKIDDSVRLVRYKGQHIGTEFERFYMNVSPDKLMDPLIHKHHFQTFLNTGKECKAKHKFILVLIYSASYKFDGRQVIRNTFGSISNFANRDIEYVFVLGQTNNDTLQDQIEKENVRYKDMIQGNFIDSYKNLTFKRVFSLFWVNKYCKDAIFVIKIDDDIIINIPFLINYLNDKESKKITNVLECFTMFKIEPYREPRSKWYTSVSDYPFPTFPPYCAGPSSIMSINVIRQMYKATSIVPFFWLEDVYGSGFLPWVLNIKVVQPNCYIKDMHQSVNKKPCHLFYINNLKNVSDSYEMWKTLETGYTFKQNHSCKCW